MENDINREHPIHGVFRDALHASLFDSMGLKDEAIERYLQGLLVEFLSFDGIYKIRDASGRRVRSVSEMVEEGDIRLNATSFGREREVHKHLGDFLLFWSGMFPEELRHLPAPDRVIDCEKQGKYSYYVVSTFDHKPYDEEAPVFRCLSENFEAFRLGLSMVRKTLLA